MKIKLAGYNVDADMLGYHINDNPQDMTPETVAAAYARISRSEKSVDELRKDSAKDVAAARKSNETIVFEYGHASIAEHAVFNFDIMDVSRLAIESIEHSRLVSFTEKSQRYLKLKGMEEVHTPSEMGDFMPQFRELMRAQMDAYHQLLVRLQKHADEHGRPQGGGAAEDARYVTGLAVTGQLGMTINARNLETMVRRLLSHPLQEVQNIGQALHRQAITVAPSLLRHCTPEPIRQLYELPLPAAFAHAAFEGSVSIVHTSPYEPDDQILMALMHRLGQAPYEVCRSFVTKMTKEDKWKDFCQIYERMELHSAAPRCFELPDVTVELVGSASFFAQLKRHRMATILPQSYDLNLGVTVPQAVIDAGATDVFDEMRDRTEQTYRECTRKLGSKPIAEYCLMQAHRRRVLVKMNARELYAFSRLREDGHAQWEVRAVAAELIEAVRGAMPMTLALACGKDEFDACKARVLSSPSV